jgi:putative endonuclease
MTRHRQVLGAAGEALAAEWYLERGYAVLDRNWRRREGEIDLIVARGSEVVFCEVKTRSSTAFGSPAEAVTPTKQHRIRRLAAAWLRESRQGWSVVRFDIAGVMDGQVDLIEAAF